MKDIAAIMRIAPDTTAAGAAPIDPIDQVFVWILSGASQHEIVESIRKFFPDSKPKPLMVNAMKRIADSSEAEPATVRGWCIEATRYVYQKALEVNDLATALRAIKQLHTLAG